MHNKKIIFGVLIGLLVVIIGGFYFFTTYSKSSQGAAVGISPDWCKSKELSESISHPDLGIPQENIAGLVKESVAYAQLASQQAEKQGVKISQSEFCALQILETKTSIESSKEYMNTNQSTSLKVPLVDVVELAQYIGNDRAAIVLDYQNREIASSGKDASAKAVIASASAGIHGCVLEKTNRVLEPKSGYPICQTSQQNSQNAALWGDLEKVGGTWGGCIFKVNRNADGIISDVQFCATLPSGIQAVCTLNRCSYGGQ